MVKFEANIITNKRIEIQELYAIYGRDKMNNMKLLIVGNRVNNGDEVPVIDVTDGCQTACCYLYNASAADVCENFGIIPQSAHYIYNYEDFNLIFQYYVREDF